MTWILAGGAAEYFMVTVCTLPSAKVDEVSTGRPRVELGPSTPQDCPWCDVFAAAPQLCTATWLTLPLSFAAGSQAFWNVSNSIAKLLGMPVPVLGSVLVSASPYPREPPSPLKPSALRFEFWITKAMPSAGGTVEFVNWNWKLVVNPFCTTCGVLYHADAVLVTVLVVSCNTTGFPSPPAKTGNGVPFRARHDWFELKSGV